jgi:hypothetical protein
VCCAVLCLLVCAVLCCAVLLARVCCACLLVCAVLGRVCCAVLCCAVVCCAHLRVYADSSRLKALKRMNREGARQDSMSLSKLDSSMLFTGD